jgi:hypothetical protein
LDGKGNQIKLDNTMIETLRKNSILKNWDFKNNKYTKWSLYWYFPSFFSFFNNFNKLIKKNENSFYKILSKLVYHLNNFKINKKLLKSFIS